MSFERPARRSSATICDGTTAKPAPPTTSERMASPVLAMMRASLGASRCSLYPVIPSTPNLHVNMKPGFSEACAASSVDCHLVDLEPLFKGQHFGADQTHPDDQGGVLIGDAWWKAMQENCIAQ